MSQSIITKAFSFGIAAMVTLSIMLSMDALARTEQSSALAAGNGATQSACMAPAKAPRS